ncbi:hypothetical protein K438DRAFT_588723 [Mycena galopus ATCC 62051]|nr:hypothetical protein K438DRAFT_588723 [Mycena galopus ATCC 62051]
MQSCTYKQQDHSSCSRRAPQAHTTFKCCAAGWALRRIPAQRDLAFCVPEMCAASRSRSLPGASAVVPHTTPSTAARTPVTITRLAPPNRVLGALALRANPTLGACERIEDANGNRGRTRVSARIRIGGSDPAATRCDAVQRIEGARARDSASRAVISPPQPTATSPLLLRLYPRGCAARRNTLRCSSSPRGSARIGPHLPRDRHPPARRPIAAGARSWHGSVSGANRRRRRGVGRARGAQDG